MSRALVISFDRLHAGYLGCYGNDWIETEHLDRLAASALVFDGHFADDLAPEDLGRHWWWQRVAEVGHAADGEASRRRPLALTTVLRQSGVRSVCFAESDLSTSSRATPLWDDLTQIEAHDEESAEEAELPVHELATAVIEGIERGELTENCLMWVRSRGVPEPWYPAGEFAELYFPEFELVDDEPVSVRPSQRSQPDDDADEDEEVEDEDTWSDRDEEVVSVLSTTEEAADPELELRVARALYAAYVTSIDRAVGRILHALSRAKLLDDTLVIVTAAAGQLLGEHAVPGELPRHLPYELTHTPLIVRTPSDRFRGTRRSHLVQSGDVFDALVQWFKQRRTANDGRDAAEASNEGELFRAIEDVSPGRTHVVSCHPELGWSVRTEAAVYCRRPGEAEGTLFLQPFDRTEFADESAQQVDLVEELAALIPANDVTTGR